MALAAVLSFFSVRPSTSVCSQAVSWLILSGSPPPVILTLCAHRSVTTGRKFAGGRQRRRCGSSSDCSSSDCSSSSNNSDCSSRGAEVRASTHPPRALLLSPTSQEMSDVSEQEARGQDLGLVSPTLAAAAAEADDSDSDSGDELSQREIEAVTAELASYPDLAAHERRRSIVSGGGPRRTITATRRSPVCSVSPAARVREYPGNFLSAKGGKLFCGACLSAIGTKASIVRKHLSTTKHTRYVHPSCALPCADVLMMTCCVCCSMVAARGREKEDNELRLAHIDEYYKANPWAPGHTLDPATRSARFELTEIFLGCVHPYASFRRHRCCCARSFVCCLMLTCSVCCVAARASRSTRWACSAHFSRGWVLT